MNFNEKLRAFSEAGHIYYADNNLQIDKPHAHRFLQDGKTWEAMARFLRVGQTLFTPSSLAPIGKIKRRYEKWGAAPLPFVQFLALITGKPIIVSSGLNSRIVSSKRLGSISLKFKKMLATDTREKLSGKIDLLNYCEDFFDYLETGRLEINGENAHQLLWLGEEHCIEELKKKCFKFIAKANKSLALAFATRTCNISYFAKLLKGTNLKAELSPSLTIYAKAKLSHEELLLLDKLNEISSFCLILNEEIGFEEMKSLISRYSLTGFGNKKLITVPPAIIPDSFLSLFKKSKEEKTPFLRALNLNNSFYARLDPAVIAPFFEEIWHLYLMNSLIETISLPNAREIELYHCYNLKKVSAPLAEKVFAGSCHKIEIFDAPLSKIDCKSYELDFSNLMT